MADKEKKIVILGAGPCGLATAWSLVKRGFCNITILEKDATIGGLVKSKIFNGNPYECGAHYFHADEKAIIEQVLNLLDGKYTANKRNLMIKFKGKYFQYPLRINDLVKGFSFYELVLLFASLIYALIKNKIRPARLITAEDVLKVKYGNRLYKKFFEGYIVNFWAMHPSLLSANFALRRIHRLDAHELLRKITDIFKNGKGHTKQDEFIEVVSGYLYYPQHGMGEIWGKIADEIIKFGGKILTDIEIKEIATTKKDTAWQSVNSISFESDGKMAVIPADILISTIPIFPLLNCLPGINENILEIASQLRYRSLVIIGLLVAKQKILPSYCTYFRDCIFSRISEPKIAGLEVFPKDHTILLAEVSCNFGDVTWQAGSELTERVITELIREGLLNRDDIKEVHVIKERYAYPIFDLDYEQKLARIQNYLLYFSNLFLTGRQGLFQYVNTHKAMKMGFELSTMLEKEEIKNINSKSLVYM